MGGAFVRLQCCVVAGDFGEQAQVGSGDKDENETGKNSCQTWNTNSQEAEEGKKEGRKKETKRQRQVLDNSTGGEEQRETRLR